MASPSAFLFQPVFFSFTARPPLHVYVPSSSSSFQSYLYLTCLLLPCKLVSLPLFSSLSFTSATYFILLIYLSLFSIFLFFIWSCEFFFLFPTSFIRTVHPVFSLPVTSTAFSFYRSCQSLFYYLFSKLCTVFPVLLSPYTFPITVTNTLPLFHFLSSSPSFPYIWPTYTYTLPFLPLPSSPSFPPRQMADPNLQWARQEERNDPIGYSSRTGFQHINRKCLLIPPTTTAWLVSGHRRREVSLPRVMESLAAVWMGREDRKEDWWERCWGVVVGLRGVVTDGVGGNRI